MRHPLPDLLRRLAMVALLAVSGCDRSPISGPPAVVGRVGGMPAASVVPPSSPRTIRLAAVARTGFRLPQGQAVEVGVERPASEVLFSLGVPGRRGLDVRYRVSMQNADGSWREIFREEVRAAVPRWLDRRVKISDEVPVEATIRFEAEPVAVVGGRLLRALVGSVRFIGPEPSRDQPPPNVVLISLDTLGARYLGHYGNSVPASPKMDRWLAEAFTFERAYVPYGNTLVSHSSLFSGRYPQTHGRIEGRKPLPELDSLVRRFAEAGYRTEAFTENGYVNSTLGFADGFDAYSDGPGKLLRDLTPWERRGAQQTFERARAWLREQGKGAPFFLFVHTYEVHTPYTISSEEGRALANSLTPGDERDLGMRSGSLVDRHGRGVIKLSEADIARLLALYLGRIRTLDDLAGELLADLAGEDWDENTIVVVTSDHGEQFGEYGQLGHGRSPHGAALQVPMAFRWQGRIRPQRAAVDVELLDVMPTLLELAELGVPEDLEGRSVASLLLGEVATLDAAPSFAEFESGRKKCPKPGADGRCGPAAIVVRLGGWKLIRYLDDGALRLVDLSSDPGEDHDLAETHPEKVAELSALIDRYLVSANGASPGAATIEIGDDLVERLRALGYDP